MKHTFHNFDALIMKLSLLTEQPEVAEHGHISNCDG